MKRDTFDWPEITREILGADAQAMVRTSRDMQQSLDKLQIIVDQCVDLCLCNRVQNDLLQAQLKLQSQRLDALTDLMPVLEEWNKQNKGETQ